MTLKLMGRKRGMVPLFNERGQFIPCTVISFESNVVVQVKKRGEKDGYGAIQLGAEKVAAPKKRKVGKPLVGHFARAKVEPMRYLWEARMNDGDLEKYREGQEIGVDFFSGTSFVDVCGISKGKGFQGVMKRYGCKGGPGAHGSGFHRSIGSTGMRSTPGRSLPKTRQAGRMGGKRVTVEGLEVLRIDGARGVMLVKGSIPGARNGSLYVRRSLKKAGGV